MQLHCVFIVPVCQTTESDKNNLGLVGWRLVWCRVNQWCHLIGLEMTFAAGCEGNPPTIGCKFTFHGVIARNETMSAVGSDVKMAPFIDVCKAVHYWAM